MLNTIGIVSLFIVAWLLLGVVNYFWSAKMTGDPIARMSRKDRRQASDSLLAALFGPIGTIFLAVVTFILLAGWFFESLGDRFLVRKDDR
jgi:hypothetical protein